MRIKGVQDGYELTLSQRETELISEALLALEDLNIHDSEREDFDKCDRDDLFEDAQLCFKMRNTINKALKA